MVESKGLKKSILDRLYRNSLISLPDFRAGKKLRFMYTIFLKRIEAPKTLGSVLRHTHFEKNTYISNMIFDDSICYETLWKNLYVSFQHCIQDTSLLKQGLRALLWDEPIPRERERNIIDCIQSILEQTRKGIKKYQKLCLKKTCTPGIFFFC